MNKALNGQIVLIMNKYQTNNPDETQKVYDQTGLGWVIVAAKVADNPIEYDEVLGIVTGFGAHRLTLVIDNFGTRSVRVVALHEMAHLLGGGHVKVTNLLYPVYGKKQSPCVDRLTMLQIAEYKRIDPKYLNYCPTPELP